MELHVILLSRMFFVDASEPEIREIPVSFVIKDGVKLKNEINHTLHEEKSPTGNVAEYIIKVYTGDKRGAGTDANVHIILFGNEDTSEIFQLIESLEHRDPFERGKVSAAVI